MPMHRKNKCRHGGGGGAQGDFNGHRSGASRWFLCNVHRTRRRNKIAKASRRANRGSK